MTYWPVEVVTAVGGPPLANVRQLAGEGQQDPPTFCALTSDGAIWCWGGGHYGQLGRGDTADGSFARPVLADATTPFSNAAEVRIGWQTACARKTDGSVWCWGQNGWGELPTSPNQAAPYPVRITLPGSGDQALSTRLISVADRTWCSIMKDTSVVCWGDDERAQAGMPIDYNILPPAVQLAPPTRVLTASGGPPLSGVVDVTSEGVDGWTCARTSGLDVFCWGNLHPYAQPYLDATQTAVSGVRVPLAGTFNGLVYVDANGVLRSNGKVLQSQPCGP
jgi:alpha-tubulin suppressor-like RCC1 family protein